MSIDELNELVASDEIEEFIRVCEARQCKELSHIADTITARGGIRLVLLAGASSAGKTTTARRLATQLRVNGAKVVYVSTDDYFVGDQRNPRDADGNFDYETIEAVDIERLNADLAQLASGGEIGRRCFDFVRHEGYDSTERLRLAPGGIVILEGIHALNPRLGAAVGEAAKFRVFVEPHEQPELFFHTRLKSSDARLLRRLVRDNQFRKLSPLDTFALWPKVLAGEEKWINPYRPRADVEFDSSLAYELAVLKPYVAGLLERVRRVRPGETMAEYFCELLAMVSPVSPVVVPGDSILRETIGNSQLDY